MYKNLYKDMLLDSFEDTYLDKDLNYWDYYSLFIKNGTVPKKKLNL